MEITELYHIKIVNMITWIFYLQLEYHIITGIEPMTMLYTQRWYNSALINWTNTSNAKGTWIECYTCHDYTKILWSVGSFCFEITRMLSMDYHVVMAIGVYIKYLDLLQRSTMVYRKFNKSIVIVQFAALFMQHSTQHSTGESMHPHSSEWWKVDQLGPWCSLLFLKGLYLWM